MDTVTATVSMFHTKCAHAAASEAQKLPAAQVRASVPDVEFCMAKRFICVRLLKNVGLIIRRSTGKVKRKIQQNKA